MLALLVMTISLKFIMENYWHVFHIWYIPACADTDGQGQGVRTPTKNHKTIGFLTVQIQCYQGSNQCFGRETVFRWRADDGPFL